jgi:hypothetical protein
VGEEAMTEAPRQDHLVRIELPVLLSLPDPSDRSHGRTGSRCASHDSWEALFEHLLTEFPTVPPHRVLTLLSQANFSLGDYGLDKSTTLEMAETVARYQLGMTVDDTVERARLDRQKRRRGRSPAG